jgi:signal transduction histidine kinase
MDALRAYMEGHPEPSSSLDALTELSARLGSPALVLLSFAPRLADAVERGDFRSLLISADAVERNAANLAGEIAAWEWDAQAATAANGRPDDRTADLTRLLVHEVRTPITIIQGCAATLRRALDHLDRSNLMKMAEAIERSAARLSELIASFQYAEGFSDDPAELHLESVALGAFTSQVVGELEPLTAPHSTNVLVVNEVDISADPVRLRQVITNLIGNASKFSPPRSPIRILIDRFDANARLSVLDHGPGVPEERREEVFERFARLDQSVPGAGLGLWVSRAIARAHGGDLTVNPAAEGGACFVLDVPVRETGDVNPRSRGRSR